LRISTDIIPRSSASGSIVPTSVNLPGSLSLYQSPKKCRIGAIRVSEWRIDRPFGAGAVAR
jgi:hypothetical protein